MHELSIAQDLFRVVERKARDNSLTTLTKIVLVLGEASGVDGEFLRDSLKEHILPGTIAEKAELEIRREPIRARCTACGMETDYQKSSSLRCPICGGASLEITQGMSLYIEKIEGE